MALKKQYRNHSAILGVVALILSRLSFVFIDDPEGPNLLIVVVLALVLYALSLVSYKLYKSSKLAAKLSFAAAVQIVFVALAVIFLK